MAEIVPEEWICPNCHGKNHYVIESMRGAFFRPAETIRYSQSAFDVVRRNLLHRKIDFGFIPFECPTCFRVSDSEAWQ